MAELGTSPSQEALEAHLASIRFLQGVECGRWEILRYTWPHFYVRVTGIAWATGTKFAHDFHFECEGYPDPGPFVERWLFKDTTTSGERPIPPTVGSPGFLDALKDWHENNQAIHGGIYRAWQRTASNHGNWASSRPDEAWNRSRTIVFIMEQLFALVSEQASWLAARAA